MLPEVASGRQMNFEQRLAFLIENSAFAISLAARFSKGAKSHLFNCHPFLLETSLSVPFFFFFKNAKNKMMKFYDSKDIDPFCNCEAQKGPEFFKKRIPGSLST